jgi:hypothetical protein
MAAFPARDRDRFDAHWAKIRRDDAVALRTILAGGVVAGSTSSWQCGFRRDRAEEARMPGPEDGIEEFVLVLPG